ncbi:hypothetical protein OUZ56_017578 [Daphnia magna]|uniref:Glutamine amidotransferase domain-containing protein n=1 Tax=Daphnia magna TaxID=35525 RepID=A0ABR0AT47_9CRUS|nr:hypothetical protein OUZ56_017578 [Daphnia magna]
MNQGGGRGLRCHAAVCFCHFDGYIGGYRWVCPHLDTRLHNPYALLHHLLPATTPSFPTTYYTTRTPKYYTTIYSAPTYYTQAIKYYAAQRVRDQCVESANVLALETPAALLLQQGYKAILISGGLNSVYAADAPLYDPTIFTCDLPVPGICYACNLLNKELGGTVAGEKRCLRRWAIRDPSRNGVPIV